MPILVRPVREQLEHDRIIRLLEAQWRPKYKVDANPGDERNAAVKIGASTLFPDLVLTEEGGRKPRAVVEVETGESVNHLEAMAQWANLAKSKSSLYLFVPVGSAESARRLAADHRIHLAALWTYLVIGDQVRFTSVLRGNGGEELILSDKPISAPPPRRVLEPVAAEAPEPTAPQAQVMPGASTKPGASAKPAQPGKQAPAKADAAPKAPVVAKAPAVSKGPSVSKGSAATKLPMAAKAKVAGKSAVPTKAPLAPKEPSRDKAAAGPARTPAPAVPPKAAAVVVTKRTPATTGRVAAKPPPNARNAARVIARPVARAGAARVTSSRTTVRPATRAVAARPSNGRTAVKRAPARPAAKQAPVKAGRAQKRR